MYILMGGKNKAKVLLEITNYVDDNYFNPISEPKKKPKKSFGKYIVLRI